MHVNRSFLSCDSFNFQMLKCICKHLNSPLSHCIFSSVGAFMCFVFFIYFSKCNHAFVRKKFYNHLFLQDFSRFSNIVCCCDPTRSLTMQMGRNALGVPVPSRRTVCHHVPPCLRSTPYQSGTGPAAPPCRMELVMHLSHSVHVFSLQQTKTQD